MCEKKQAAEELNERYRAVLGRIDGAGAQAARESMAVDAVYFDTVAENDSLRRSITAAYAEVDRLRGMLDREIGRDTKEARAVVCDTRAAIRERKFRDAASPAAPAEVDAAERESLGYRVEDIERRLNRMSDKAVGVHTLDAFERSVRESIGDVEARVISRIQQLDQQTRVGSEAVLAGVRQMLEPVNNDIQTLANRTEDLRARLESLEKLAVMAAARRADIERNVPSGPLSP